MAILKRLANTLIKLFQNEPDNKCEPPAPEPEGKGTRIPVPQAPDRSLPDNRLYSHEVSCPSQKMDSGTKSVQNVDQDASPAHENSSFTIVPSGIAPTVCSSSAAATWGTPLELLHVSEECYELLQGFNIETIEDLAEREEELLRDRRLNPDLRFEVKSQLAEWRSHSKQLTRYIFGEGTSLDQASPTDYIDEEAYSTVSDLTETPLEGRWSQHPFDAIWQEPSESSPAHCHTCDTPLEVLRSLTEDRGQLPIELATERISEACETECMYLGGNNKRCTEDDVNALLRQLDERWVLKKGVLYLQPALTPTVDTPSGEHEAQASSPFVPPSPEDESAVSLGETAILGKEATTDATTSIGDGKANPNAYEKLPSEPNFPSAQSTQGLDPEEIRTFLLSDSMPMHEGEIVAHFDGRFSASQIRVTMADRKAFEEIDGGYYAVAGRWAQIGIQDILSSLSEPLKSFVVYLTTRNNSSYKPVLGYIFLQKMDKNGCLTLLNLRTEIYEYYQDRHRHGLTVEAEGLTATKVNEMEFGEFTRKLLQEPMKSFQRSYHFSIDKTNKYLQLSNSVIDSLSEYQLKLAKLALLKGIETYYNDLPTPNVAQALSVDYTIQARSLYHDNSKISEDDLASLSYHEELHDGQEQLDGETLLIRRRRKTKISL